MDHEGKPTPQSAAIVEPSKCDQNKSDNNKNWHEQNWYVGIKEGLEIIAIIVGIVVAAVMVFQLKAMIDANKIIRGQLDEMKHTREMDERAWVFVSLKDNSLEVDTNSGGVLVFNAILKNPGKTPAFITGTWSQSDISTNAMKRIDPKVDGLNIMLAPSDSCTFQVPISAVTTLKLLKGEKAYLWGTCFYKDVSENEHWTQFSFYLDKAGSQTFRTTFHNSCDDDGIKQKIKILYLRGVNFMPFLHL